ncbi:MAG: S41 family peptidase [Rhodospirillales bacterium]|nr:S41 family peptidase [Rhodospirillales bacterium]
MLAYGTHAGFAADSDKVKNSAETYRLLNLFGDVFERVRNDYVEKPSDEQLIESAITGMLSALDPHSSYMNSDRFDEMKVNTRGEFGGLGIQVSMEDGFVKVISPIDDTPAYRAGVEPGDYITHLDGESVQGLTLQEAVEKMRGKVGADIKITIRRKGTPDPFDVTITRAVIKITSVRSRIEGKVGYVRITSFTEQSDIGLKKAMDKFDKELGDGLIGIVLDLRNNPGGLLDQAVAISDAFLERGEIVSTRSRLAEDTSRFSARAGDLAKGKPIVVLINGGSASASEIVAGALQDHKRAVILGTRSFGKGSVQTIMPLPGHGAMRLTTARYYTPSGRSIQGEGVDPDIIVEPSKIETLTSATQRREADLRGALKNENGGNEETNDAVPDENLETAPMAESDTKEEPVDYQLTRALDLIRGISLFTANQAVKAE